MNKIVSITLAFTLLLAVNVKASHIAGAEITYDRWGLKVFESNDITQSWDGKNAEDGTTIIS